MLELDMERSLRDNELRNLTHNSQFDPYLQNTSNSRLNNLLQKFVDVYSVAKF